jgi:myo-inositol-1(or 4)-monophosphatase
MTHFSQYPMLNTAVMAARAAGSCINRATRHLDTLDAPLELHSDLFIKLVAQIQTAAVQVINKAYPQHSIYSSQALPQVASLNSPFVWFVQALEGASNWAHGFPAYAVSIALGVEERIEQAVVFDPLHNQLFTASRGGGAYLDGRRLRMSRHSSANHPCLLSVALSGDEAKADDVRSINPLTVFEEAGLGGYQNLRSQGCPALELAYVAAGYVDAFVGKGLDATSMAAGTLLVTEAGGLTSMWSGEPWSIDHGQCLASVPRVHARLVHVLSTAMSPV